MTLLKQTSLFTKETLTSLVEDSHANHTQRPDLEKEKKTNAIYGHKCLEQFEKLNQVGLWAKTFAALLIGGGGVVFDEVQVDLEAEGYEVLPFLLPACGVNAPHRRDRIWFIAYANNKGTSARFGQIQKEDGKISEWNNDAKLSDSSYGNVTDSDGDGLQGGIFRKCNDKQGRHRQIGITKEYLHFNKSTMEARKWDNFPTKPSICGGNDGLPRELDGITFSKWKIESIKAYGNAIVPQVAYEIFKTIKQIEHEKRNPRP
jgi:DNA (cytosine-5)-methyltransferase 1